MKKVSNTHTYTQNPIQWVQMFTWWLKFTLGENKIQFWEAPIFKKRTSLHTMGKRNFRHNSHLKPWINVY